MLGRPEEERKEGRESRTGNTTRATIGISRVGLRGAQVIVYVAHGHEFGSKEGFGCCGLGGCVGEMGTSFAAREEV